MDVEYALEQVERIIRANARKMASALCPAEDLAQEGRVAAFRAWSDYRPERGKWQTYATGRAVGAMRHYLRDHGPLIRVSARQIEKGYPQIEVVSIEEEG